MAKRKKICASIVLVATFVVSSLFVAFASPKQSIAQAVARGAFTQVSKDDPRIKDLKHEYGDTVRQLSDNARRSEYITMIADLGVTAQLETAGDRSLSEVVGTAAYSDAQAKIDAAQSAFLRTLKKEGIGYTVEQRYNTVFAGVAVKVKSSDYARVQKLAENAGGDAYVSEEYAAPKAVESGLAGTPISDAQPTAAGVTTNLVNVHETGIFNSDDAGYDGEGTVVAVLDSGFDYTHTVFSQQPPKDTLTMTMSTVTSVLGETRAKKLAPSTLPADVYVSDKIPFAFDYADNDADVYPLESEHGTHVASIIAGNDTQNATYRGEQLDYKVRGVAPNAQLVLLKVFSDVDTGAKQHDILAALEDCVLLGVDVINMSLGMSAGFATEKDSKGINAYYDAVRDAGISLICAASNDYNSTFGSEANGNLPLTSNPDSATVGSPSTYTAALSVASISGVMTPYLEFEGEPIYYLEANDTSGKAYSFIDTMLGGGTSGTFTYVRVPGIGQAGDYQGTDVRGKIALVRRGQITFEEKVQAAKAAGAIGVMIYNNVSGDIRMSVGNYLTGWNMGCISMSQDDGEKLAAKPSGVITLRRSNQAGPFMSDFSSWGPLPDLGIKPEITAHGGDILAAIPGQKYDRLSGTSMASPNQAGVHTLVRQYVKKEMTLSGEGAAQRRELARRVDRLIMSTTDIANNERGNPYSVRKQGAGLANLTKATTTRSFIKVKEYDAQGVATANEKDRPKLELGDDPDRTGVYTLRFTVQNVSNTSSSFDASALVFTEGISSTLTDKQKTTSDQHAYMLDDTKIELTGVTSSSGTSTPAGNRFTVDANSEVDVVLTLTLSDAAKSYIDNGFEFGMYVEGYVTLTATDDGVDLNAPFLAFYGDWAEAPIFDLTYFETNPDELNDAIDSEDKIKPDAWATRPIGGIKKDSIGFMGTYFFVQNPADTPIPAQEEHISLSIDDDALNNIYAVWAGLLRSCAAVDVTITEKSTGEVIYTKTEEKVRKSYSYGSSIGYGSVDVDFYVKDYNLKNNTQYTVRLDAHLDYKNDGTTAEHKNSKNSYEFTFTTDFSAPILKDVHYYTEYDKDTKETHVYADLQVFDNHYTQCIRPIMFITGRDSAAPSYYVPVYGNRNTTNTVTLDLTAYMQYIKMTPGFSNLPYVGESGSTFMVAILDYALNQSIYQLHIPDYITAAYYATKDYTISVNETLRLDPELLRSESFASELSYVSSNPSVAKVVDDTLVGVGKGTATISVKAYDYELDENGKLKEETGGGAKRTLRTIATLNVKVLGEGDEGFMRLDKPLVKSFGITGYKVQYAHYARYSDDVTVGETGDYKIFSGARGLKMNPGESIQLIDNLVAYYGDQVYVEYSSGDASIAEVSENGVVKAKEKGKTQIMATVMAGSRSKKDGTPTMYSASVSIEVLDPYETQGAYLMGYHGLGGVVEIPARLRLINISKFAFSLAKSVDRPLEEVDEENPYYTTSGPVGDQRPAREKITQVIIPEGVEVIDQYAFAKLSALERVVLPKTLRQINAYAFQDCVALQSVEGLENVQIISQNAFANCKKLKTSEFGSSATKLYLTEAVAIGAGAFSGCTALTDVTLGKAQSVGAGAFSGCTNLTKIDLGKWLKMDAGIFLGCTKLNNVTVNAPVISDGAFSNCSALTTVILGKDVSEIGYAAFAGTSVQQFQLAADHTTFTLADGGKMLLRGSELVCLAPGATTATVPSSVTTIGRGAFSSAKGLTEVTLLGNVAVGDYAFFNLSSFATISGTGKIESVGKYAFAGTALTALPDLSLVTAVGAYAFVGCTELSGAIALPNVTDIGAYAFAGSAVTKVTLKDAATETDPQNRVAVGDGAFADCASLTELENTTSIVSVGAGAFRGALRQPEAPASPLTIEIALKDAKIGRAAFYDTGITALTLTGTCTVDPLAFARTASIGSVSLGGAQIGAYAFADSAVTTVTGLGQEVGEFAFASTSVTAVNQSSGKNDLSGVRTLGKYAFANTPLENVTLGAQTNLGEGAFASVDPRSVRTVIAGKRPEVEYTFKRLANGVEPAANLTTVLGVPAVVAKMAFYNQPVETADLSAVTTIGELAFAGSNLTAVDLTGAVHVGRLAFAGSSNLAAVTFGTALKRMDDNPFAMTAVKSFAKEGEPDKFGIKNKLYTYDLSSTVKVIDDAVYMVVPNGLELVGVPAKTTKDTITVADDTVRLGDYSFAGTGVSIVYLPYALKSVGHAAFYGCSDLRTVHFGSLEAPALEAEYDENYLDIYSLTVDGDSEEPNEYDEEDPQDVYYYTHNTSGSYMIENDLYVREWLQWFSMAIFNNNFVDYLDSTNGDGKNVVSAARLTMTYPANATGYENAIYDKFFTYKVKTAVVADDFTRSVIASILALPETIKLDDEDAITKARLAFNGLSAEQQALVPASAVAKLVEAEELLASIKPTPEPPATAPTASSGSAGKVGLTVAVVLLSVVAVALAAVLTVLLLKKKEENGEGETAQENGEAETPAEPTQENADAETPAETAQENAEAETAQENAESEPSENPQEQVSDEKPAPKKRKKSAAKENDEKPAAE